MASATKGNVTTEGWSLESLLRIGENFHEVPRVAGQSENCATAIADFEHGGIPLILECWHEHKSWPINLFNPEWLREHGPQEVSARNIHNWTDEKLPISTFIDHLRQYAPYAGKKENKRLYGKDAVCPILWAEWLNQSEVIPASLTPNGSNNLINMLADPVETLMCYLGIGDTFTPCHKDLCASSGQNLMCYTENGGSSYWFMTKTSDSPVVSEYFHSLGRELDHETHVMTLDELAKAPFDVYIAEQKLGDLVLVPSRSIHQVVNNGGMTVKMSWSRMTINCLTAALYHELPIYRRVCRVETYQVKAMLHKTLLSRVNELDALLSDDPGKGLSQASTKNKPSASTSQYNLTDDLHKLQQLFDDVLVEEYSERHSSLPCLSKTPNAANGLDPYRITCDFCSGDIFQSFFECRKCVEPAGDSSTTSRPHNIESGDGLILCPSCFVEGRTCVCEDMTPLQCRPFAELLQDRQKVIRILKRARQGVEIAEESHLLSNKTIGLFRAACILHNLRNKKSGQKACTYRSRADGPPSHSLPFSSVRPCKQCHASKCYTCILDDMFIHSAESLHLISTDKTHKMWHRRHKKFYYEQAKLALIAASRAGTRPDLRHYLVYAALNYRNCQPANPTYTKPGFYDRLINIIQASKPAPKALHPDEGSLHVPTAVSFQDRSHTNGEPSLAQSTSTPVASTSSHSFDPIPSFAASSPDGGQELAKKRKIEFECVLLEKRPRQAPQSVSSAEDTNLVNDPVVDRPVEIVN